MGDGAEHKSIWGCPAAPQLLSDGWREVWVLWLRRSGNGSALAKGVFLWLVSMYWIPYGRKQKESLRTLGLNTALLPRGFHLLKAKRESSAFGLMLVTDTVVHCHWVLLFCGGVLHPNPLTWVFISRFLRFYTIWILEGLTTVSHMI